ncbi:ABC transporter permease [Nitratireductor luteus]|uniref:ABC transporter permease n=1 Tax=Nitratireductor luteus TaxID=2976980 RepID=UPI00223F54D3|nr:ABC transporter permease [Nitratireductor luteus]
MFATIKSALADICAGLRMRRVWIALAQEDIGDQHRRTALGPLWLLINYLAFAGTFIFVFHRGDAGSANYAAHVATGLLVWFYIMETITQSVSLFVREESFIKGTTLPLSVYVMRLAMQAAIRAGYALAGCIAILLMSGVGISFAWIWSALAILLILATTPAAIILFAFLGAYFPDSQFVVSNLMRIGMFLTPVFWTYEGTGGVQHIFYYWNPFTYFLEIVRMPILSGSLPANAFLFCAAASLTLWAVALMLLGRFRKQVVFVI